MRRLLWLTLAGLLGLLLVGALYFTNPLSVRTWILGKALRSSVSSIRDAAASTLVDSDPEEAAEIFVQSLQAASGGSVWEESCWRFALLPPEIAGNLARMLDDPNPLRADAAAHGLTVLAYRYEDHDFTAALPALFRALDRGHAGLCQSAGSAISLIGSGDADTVKKMLRAERKGCRGFIVFSLAGMELSGDAMEELLNALADEDPELRRSVAGVLGALKAHEERLAPRLLALLGDQEASVVEAALHSLEGFERRDPDTVAKVIALLDRKEARAAAIHFLVRSIAVSREALAAVRRGLQDTSQPKEFVDELGNVFPDHSFSDLIPDLIPDLLHLCRADSRPELRVSAVEVLGAMGSEARSAVPAIEEILAKDDDEDFEWAARIAIRNMKEE